MVSGGVIVVSNRLPVTIIEKAGSAVVERSIGGLATALASVVGRTGAKWVGWTGLARNLSDKQLKQAGLPDSLLPVQASEPLMRGYYQNFSNRILWPTMHDIRPCYQPTEQDWKSYQAVNRRFAQVASRAAQPGDIIWVQDYHLLLMPKYLRAMGGQNRVGLFLHSPFPSPEYWFALPHAQKMLESLCEADVLGLQTERDVDNFRECARIIGARKYPRFVGAFPIGVDFETYNAAPATPAVREMVVCNKDAVGGKKIIFSLSRLDYTKGIVAQLLAVERFFADNPEREDFVYKLVVAPSREQVDEYQHLRQTIDRVAADINRRLGNERWQPVDYSYQNIGFEEVTSWYSASDTLLLLPETDGMNLVAKEYIATRQDDNGMLVISNTIGSSFQLPDALQVPPHDITAAANALTQATRMPEAERVQRWQGLRSSVQLQDVTWWADQFLTTLASDDLLS